MGDYAHGTWLDPEERAYPSGAISAGRRAKAMCLDGKLRTIRIGIPDTFFSIPGYTRVRGRYVPGFVRVREANDGAQQVEFLPLDGTWPK